MCLCLLTCVIVQNGPQNRGFGGFRGKHFNTSTQNRGFPLSPLQQRDTSFHRLKLNGSSSPVLTATHHSYGSPRLSDFSLSALGVRHPNGPSRKIAQTTCVRASRLCTFCSKNRYFLIPPISRPPIRSKFGKFWT